MVEEHSLVKKVLERLKRQKNNSLGLTNSQYHYHGMFGQQFDVKLQLTR